MTTIGRRALLLAAPALLAARSAAAQEALPRQIRVVVGFAPGGANDIMARLLTGRLNERVPGTSFIVENRPGAATLVAADMVARSAPDGATLMYTSNSTLIAPLVNRSATFDPARDFAPVIMAQSAPTMLLTRPDHPIRTVADMIAAAKARPGRVTVSHPGTGAINHLTMALLMRETGTDFTLVPYTGNAPSLTALVRGDVDLAHDGPLSAKSFIESGQLRPVAVTSAQRMPILPAVPTFAETIPGHVVMFWGTLFAPRATPVPVLDRLHAEIAAVLALPEIAERIRALGGEPEGGPRAALTRAIAEEYARWGTIVREANIRSE
ncbi:MAG: tripartite tricarboxylate transporter substrate binding protein [Acetobacteraceae bacterium]|nr:tripartite tricarboxylate transporter substrate binding protein [Acetobacteraceae bacterium]